MRGAVKLGEGARLLLGPGERRGGVARAVNADVNGFNAIEDCQLDERLRRGNEGEVVTVRWHPRRGAERRSVAGNRWQRG
jgi:hypothetical protein